MDDVGMHWMIDVSIGLVKDRGEGGWDGWDGSVRMFVPCWVKFLREVCGRIKDPTIADIHGYFFGGYETCFGVDLALLRGEVSNVRVVGDSYLAFIRSIVYCSLLSDIYDDMSL